MSRRVSASSKRAGPGDAPEAHEHRVVAALLGREPQGNFSVVVRDVAGAPVVIANEPFLRDGTPMPTRYWLVDPDLRALVGQLEAAGGVKAAEVHVGPEALEACHRRYAAERDALIEPGRGGPRPRGGVGGTSRGVKCLHAHLAWWLAGGDDPVGAWVARRLALGGPASARGLLWDTGHVERTPTAAAVDCGTNSTRLLIVGPSGDAKAREMRITRLGQGVDATRLLQTDALERTLDVLREYRALMDSHGVDRARLVATSAVRDAGNGDEFLTRAAEIVGVPAELLSGGEEGRLSYLGAASDLPEGTDPIVVVDIGGGSTELATAVNGDVASVSLDIGCVRLTERYLPGDPPTPAEVADAVKAIAVELDRSLATIPALAHGGGAAHLVGLAGTVSTMVSLELGLSEYDRARIHHAVLPLEAVVRWCEVLGAEPVATRRRRAGLPEGRQDVILGGALVLREVMQRFGFAECLVSESDILDGLVLSIRRQGPGT